MKRLLCAAAAAAFLFAVPIATASDGPAPEIWMFAGPFVRNPFPGWETVRRDMGEMWKPNAPWETVARAVNVVQFPPTSVSRATDQDLQLALADVNRRNLALAIGTGLLIRTDRCRSQTEAYVGEQELEHLLRKLQRDGADVKYVTMDEPFFYGHVHSGPGACHDSAETIAHALRPGIALVRKYFPFAKIGTDEVVDDRRGLVDDLAHWATVYEQVTGEKLAYLHADVSWNSRAMQNLVALSKALKTRGVPLGVSYNAAAKGYQGWFDADSVSRSDERWVQNAEQHFKAVESDLGIRPAHAVLTTWVHFPTRMLPETQPGTFTNLVYRYLSYTRSRGSERR